MGKRKAGVVVSCAPNAAGQLSVVRVDDRTVTLSTGEILIARYEKLRSLCEQLAQEGCPISIRTWITPDGNELIECHRVGATDTPPPTGRLEGSDAPF